MSNDAPYVIVIGDNGVGKSSLIKLLTNYDKIETSSGTDACTKEITFYGLLEENVCYIDTRGTEDVDSKTNDEEILNDIQRKMHSYHGNKCKFIWIVSPANRKNNHLKYQAEFIEKFGKNNCDDNDDPLEKKKENGNKNENENKPDDKKCDIWDSVLMIVSKPEEDESLTNTVQGTIDLATKYGCSQNHWKTGKNLFGFTNLSWLGDDKRKRKQTRLEHLNKEPHPGHHGNFLHCYQNHEIKEFVTKSLKNEIKSFEMFSLDYKCSKCGIIGNPKFVNDLKCHTIPIKYHPKSNDMIEKHLHENTTKKHATTNIIQYHPKPLQTKEHKGKFSSKHTMDRVLSTGGTVAIGALTTVTTVAAVAGATVGAGAALATTTSLSTAGTLGAAALSLVQSKIQQLQNSAVLKNIDVDVDPSTLIGLATGSLTAAIGTTTNTFGAGLTFMGYKTCGKYPCCGGDLNSVGCYKYWSCCPTKEVIMKSNTDSKDASADGDGNMVVYENERCSKIPGFRQRYNCCGGHNKSHGCATKYECCGKKIGSEGCITVCNNCNRGIEEICCMYKMKCCGLEGKFNQQRNDAKDGCALKCKRCDTPWGEPVSIEGFVADRHQGCSIEEKNNHDMQPLAKKNV